MERKQTSTLHVWNPEDLEIADDAIAPPMWSWRWRVFGGVSLVSAISIVVIVVVWQLVQIGQYQHIVQQNASWVAQQSTREATCFQRATTAAQRDGCALSASTYATTMQRQFGAVPVPLSQNNAAAAMQNAYAALNAAACYDLDNHTVDNACLSGISSRLQVALLDARDAAQN